MDPPHKVLRLDTRSTEGKGNGNGNAVAGLYETECRLFKTPEGCPYGDACRFRHAPASTVLSTTPAICPAAAAPPPLEESLSGLQSASRWKKPRKIWKPCRRFFSVSGCRFGDGCDFPHNVQGSVGPLGLSPLPNLGSSAGSLSGPGRGSDHKAKLRLCMRFETPEGCHFGEKCHFAHGEKELWKSDDGVGGSTERESKMGLSTGRGRSPPQATTPGSQLRGQTGHLAKRSKTSSRLCVLFDTPEGCQFGEDCLSAHGEKELSAPTTSGASQPRGQKDDPPGWWLKTLLCKRFGTPEGCRFGEDCYFAHGEKKLRNSHGAGGSTTEREAKMDRSRSRRSPAPTTSGSQLRGQTGGSLYANKGRYGGGHDSGGRGYYGLTEPRPTGTADVESFGASASAKISVKASRAGVIFGEDGVNVTEIRRVTGIRLSLIDHETDATLRSVKMEGSLEQIGLASQMVRQVLSRGRSPPSTTSGSQLRGQTGGSLFASKGRYGGGRDSGGRGDGLREPTPPDTAAVASFGASSSAKISLKESLADVIYGKGGENFTAIRRLTGVRLSVIDHDRCNAAKRGNGRIPRTDRFGEPDGSPKY